MRRRSVPIVLAGVVWWAAPMMVAGAVAAWVTPASAAVPSGGGWRKAFEVPGLASLNRGGSAFVNEVSCASAGNCAAGGSYRDGSGRGQGFVVSERNGVWRKVFEVPGLGALNKGGNAVIASASCASAGNCAVGGSYQDGSGHSQGFVVSESNGAWHRALEVPGLGRLNAGGEARITSVSCGSAGNCTAGGYFDFAHAFVVTEKKGSWRRAFEVPGLAALNKGNSAEVVSVSCASAGNCSVGGFYAAGSGLGQGFVATEKNGGWRNAIEVPGLAALSKAGPTEVTSVFCASVGNCLAGGAYPDASGHQQAFVVTERNGSWRKAFEIPGLVALNKGGLAGVLSMSCASTGNCVALGYYRDGSSKEQQQAFVVSQNNGSWQKAIEVPGLGALNKGGTAEIASVSCVSAGNCAAAGYYRDGSGHLQGFLVSRT